MKKSIGDYQFLNKIPLFSVKSNKVKEFVENCKISPFIWARLKIKMSDFGQNLAFFADNKISNTLKFSCAFFTSKHGVFFQAKKSEWERRDSIIKL